MNFFDFHVHPTMKTLFGSNTQRLSPWTNLDIRLIPNLYRWCSEFEYIIRSQANLSQLLLNECRLVCVALYAPERDMLDNELIKNNADTKMSQYLNRAKLDAIIGNSITPYDLVVTEDLPNLFTPSRWGITNKSVVALTKANQYNEQKEDTIYTVFSVEGCHTLSRVPLEQLTAQEVIQNLTDLRTRVTVVAVNLTHMQQSPLCNHAYGMQFIRKESFKPTGKGLPREGALVVEHCYRNKIMIDLKHMSLMARQHFYALRKSPMFQAINQPIICTHAGFTGIRIDEIKDFIFSARTFSGKDYIKLTVGKPALRCKGPQPAFNSSSINLFDEEIMEILNSNGMIGLSLDKRILGFADPDATEDDYALEVEYISLREQKSFYSTKKTGDAFHQGRCITNAEVDADAGEVNPRMGEYHLRHFMAQIIHLIRVCRTNQYDVNRALKQVCVGSDFDGMINPVWICDTIDNLSYFRDQFELSFVDFADDCDVKLPNGFNVKSFTDDLFYRNGRDFVMSRLNLINP